MNSVPTGSIPVQHGAKDTGPTGGGAPKHIAPYIWHHVSSQGVYENDIRPIARSDEVFVDSEYRIYLREDSGSWSQRAGNAWEAIDTGNKANLMSLHQLEQCYKRGEMRKCNFRQAQATAGSVGNLVQIHP